MELIKYIPVSKNIDFDNFVKKMEYLFETNQFFNDRINLIRRCCKILIEIDNDKKINFFIEHFVTKFNLSADLFRETLRKITYKTSEFQDIKIDENGIYFFGKGWYNVANFNITPQYIIRDENDDVNWIVKVERHNEAAEYLKLTNDDWSSAKKLAKILLKKQYIFKGGDGELKRLQEFLGKTNFANKASILGYNSQSGAYFFANSVIHNGKEIKPDEFGIAEIDNECYYMPYIENKPFKATRRFMFIKRNITFNEWAKLFYTAHLEHSVLPIAAYITSLVRDYTFEQLHFMPILYIKGKRGSVKSSIIRNITSLYGYSQDEISLKSPNTVKSLPRLLGQISNSILWLDEFYNGLNDEIKGLLQSTYDGGGYERAAFTNGIETSSIDIKSMLALTSNFFPEDEIFFSRCILININETTKSNEQRDAYNTIKDMEKDGLSCITAEILKHRHLIISDWKKEYNFLFKTLSQQTANLKVDNRMLENMCGLITPLYILLKFRKIKLNEDIRFHEKLIEIAKTNIINQHRIFFDNSDLLHFWAVIQIGIENNLLLKNIDFKIQDEVNTETGEVLSQNLVIRYNRLYSYYSNELKNKAKSKNEMIDLIRNDDSFFETIHSVKFKKGSDEFIDAYKKNDTVTLGISLKCDVLRDKFGLIIT